MLKILNSTTAILVLACVSLSQAAPASAQFGDLKKQLKKKAAQEAQQELEKELSKSTPAAAPAPASTRRGPQTAKTIKASRTSDLGKPAANLIALTTCSPLKPTSIVTGNMDNYTFQQGMSSEKRSGFINRVPGTLSNSCILPSMQPQQITYMEVDKRAYEAMGGSNNWEMQCVRSDNPGAGALTQKENKAEAPYHIGVLSGKDMMLHCGNSEGIEKCASGSNSSRSSAWKKDLTSRGKMMLSISAHTSSLAPVQGEKIYCQWYNKASNTSLFGFEYLRAKN